jgi:hypothetical protein
MIEVGINRTTAAIPAGIITRAPRGKHRNEVGDEIDADRAKAANGSTLACQSARGSRAVDGSSLPWLWMRAAGGCEPAIGFLGQTMIRHRQVFPLPSKLRNTLASRPSFGVGCKRAVPVGLTHYKRPTDARLGRLTGFLATIRLGSEPMELQDPTVPLNLGVIALRRTVLGRGSSPPVE